jgi:gluconate kinase
MKAEMLRSQFEALEEPQDALILDISLAPETICDRIVAYLEG